MIIGIDGFAGVGKDTVADILVKRGFTRVSYADELRESASASFGFTMETFLDRNVKDADFHQPFELTEVNLTDYCKRLGFESKASEVVAKFQGCKVTSPRHLLQFVGTEIARETLSQSIWLDAYKRRIKDLALVVTPDARFSNERELIQSLNGRIFYVSKKDVEASENHKSGTDKWPLERYDVLVKNDSTLAVLKHEIDLWWSLRGER